MDKLTPFFDWILAASARASLLTVVVLIVQRLLRHQVSARWCYSLWLPVLIVLLMPAFPQSSWSVSSITHLAPSSLPQLPITKQGVALPTQAVFATSSSIPSSRPWQQIMSLTWLVGTVAMMLFGIIAFTQSLWRFQRHRLPVSDALQGELIQLARRIGLRHLPQVWTSSAIRSPAVTGLLRPTLLLPAHFEQSLAPQEARFVLQHELTHIKRGDLPLHALLCLLLALHWFNPLLWLAFFKARLDREAACDSQVLGNENQTQRVAYGHTLLKVETAFGHHGLSLGFVGIFQRGAALRARIQSIASRPNLHPLMKTALSIGIVLLTFLGITKAAAPDPKAPQILIQARFIEVTSGGEPPVPVLPKVVLPPPLDAGKKVPGLLGVVPDPQFQKVIRTLSQQKGVDLASAPNVTTKDGQTANIEIVRDFGYPDDTGKQVTQNVGVTLAVIPHLKADNQIALDLSSKVVEFEGFEKLTGGDEAPVIARKTLHADGSFTDTTSDGEKGELRESRFNVRGELQSQTTVPATKAKEKFPPKPIFTERKLKENAVMPSGSTTVLEMEGRTDQQIVEDTDGTGRIISSKTVLFKRRLLVFVTASLVDPTTGKLLPQKP